MENEEKKLENKVATAVNVLYFLFMLFVILKRFVSHTENVYCVGENAFKLCSALNIFSDAFAVFIIIFSIVVFVKHRKHFKHKGRSAMCVFAVLGTVLSLILVNSLSYIRDLKNGSSEITTDLYYVRFFQNETRLAFSDGNEIQYYDITEELGAFIDDNTTASTDEDYIQTRLDEQNSFISIIPREESVVIEYYPNTKFLKSFSINE